MMPALRFGGPAVLTVAAVVLAAAWESIPARYPIHWSASGAPDAWALRAPLIVFAPLMLGMLVWIAIELCAFLLDLSSKEREIARANAVAVRAIGFSVSALFAALAVVLPLAPPARAGAVVLTSVIWLSGTIVLALAYVARTALSLKAAGKADLPKGWNGIVYSNRDDDRIFVPKLVGLGWTLNFGHPRAWLVLGAIAVPTLVALVASLALAH